MSNPFPKSERRSEDRWSHYTGCVVSVEGRMATLLDLSPWGARLEGPNNLPVNQTVRLDLPNGTPIRATVLESQPGTCRLRFAFEFEEF